MKLEIQIDKDKNKIFAPLLGKWVKYSAEEELKQKFICRLNNTYGYSLNQLGQDVKIKKRYEADIAIWRSKLDKGKNSIPSIIITVECKAEHIKIKESDYSIGYNFASTINANFFIAVNLKETKVFHIKNEIAAKKVEKLTEIPKAEILVDNNKIIKYVNENKKFTRDEFSRLLTRSHNIIRNNDKLSPESAFDEISKILFMKIMYERSSTREMIFSREKFKADEINYEEIIRPSLKKDAPHLDQDYMQYLFNETKKAFATDDLFELKDIIKIKRNSFEMIVEELEVFNLSDTSDDVKGIAFEQFLGKTFRGELGQFFTPRTIVDFMIEILDPQEGEIVCDPCCGSGGFLISAFEFIRDKIDIEINDQIKSLKQKYFNENFDTLSLSEQERISKSVQEKIEEINQEFDINNEKSRYHKLSHYSIYGTDANARMARTAKMNMIMHGDGHGGVHHNDGLLNVNGIFEGRFDVILTNPPFGSRVEKSLKVTELDLPSNTKLEKYKAKYPNYIEKVIEPLREWTSYIDKKDKSKGKPILDLFEVGKWSTSTEVLFIERCLNLLKPGGRMGIVLPEGILNSSNLENTRNYYEGKAKILFLVSLPQDVFVSSGAAVKTSLVFLKKFSVKETEDYNKICEGAENRVNDKYKREIESLNKKLRLDKSLSTADKKHIREELKSIKLRKQIEVKSLVQKEFDYEIPISDIQKAGITTTGAKGDNQLPELIEKYIKNSRKKLNTKSLQDLSFQLFRYKNLPNWSVSHLLSNTFDYNENFNFVRIGDFLSRNKTKIEIQDNVLYKRVTIRLYNKGVKLRNTAYGKDIGTKKQYLLSKDQFLISKIDARNGAFGIATEEVDEAIITADFIAYNIDTTKIDPLFLVLITSTQQFLDFAQSSSSGTTGRQRIDEKKFLDVKIPLPKLNKQKEILEKYREILRQKEIILAKEKNAKEDFEQKIFKSV
ncbi:MAG: N-6 DNA methylase [Bacteroidales bacterium]|nr:N-6 DNA methylase [Bacteroidales bacterium]